MDISSTSTTSTSNYGSIDVKKQKEIFMKTLVAQLENQDPMNPMDSKAMTQQLAQFSSVEQQMATNNLLKQMVDGNQGGGRMDAVSLLGKQAWVEDQPAVSASAGQGHDFRFGLDGSGPVRAEVKDAGGNVVRNIDLGTQPSGLNQARWDGTTDSGADAPAGEYTIEVYRQDVEDPEAISTRVASEVREVRYGDNGPELGIDGGYFVPFEQVTAVSSGTA